ncbi:hypothetical protein Gotri_015720 [Gossypium trilobum]|uniref:RNase H type-1 domain-containing protein n=1 Tax=Gossypium trilobum TaxID=34281 RepID=A0A7J9E169_9ROSI|nr:hypothetical protein [Gossypium trilobum]
MGWSEVTVEGDSLAIIKKCQTHNPNKSQIGAHIQDIQQLKDSFQSIVFKHTPRLANGNQTEALQCDGGERKEWLCHIPKIGSEEIGLVKPRGVTL